MVERSSDMDSPSEEQPDREDSPATKEMLHKTKLIQFLGRNTPIVLQNDNGPCPLLAICNVLLLRNNLNLSSDVAQVSQEKLLSLVAERLIDSNSNVDNKDAGFVKNQQQNIADAIDLLPRLTTGIDVNLKFTRIDDFEFTRECAIFDSLDIPLYHGWIVDPQDCDTSSAIGLKSYNTLMGELVALETQNPSSQLKEPEIDCVDFVAATTATLGVPSPSLSRGISFDDSCHSISEEIKERKGDLIEEEELSRALKLSETESSPTENVVNVVNTVENNQSENENSNESYLRNQEPVIPGEVHNGAENDESCPQKLSPVDNNNAVKKDYLITFEKSPTQDVCSSSQGDNDKVRDQIETLSKKRVGKVEIDKATKGLDESDLLPPVNTLVPNSGDENIQDQSVLSNEVNVVEHISDLESSKEIAPTIDESKSLTSSADGSEPIYEGEEHILEASTANYENREPMYEGEVVLAEQVDKVSSSEDETKGKDGITSKQGELIKNFLKNSANQLTLYGLFSLQEGLKEREICVFFRNNHFNTMFKFEGELYILTTDQGYISQPDLIWEKLNEVNGDTVYMTCNFKEFNAESPETRSWDEQNALANSAEYIASIDNAAQENACFNSDLQLAIALQQQEFEQQLPPPQPQQNLPQLNTNGESGLVTGPQHVQPSKPRNSSSSSSKQESKSSKEKCIVM